MSRGGLLEGQVEAGDNRYTTCLILTSSSRSPQFW